MEIEEEVINSSKDQQSHIVKGKRTKRQRPQSPIPFTISSDSNRDYYINEGNGNEILLSSPSPPTSEDDTLQDTIADQDQDMANCLILLAQGQSRPQKFAKKVDDYAIKFTSRRYLEATTTSSGKAGYFVYECKTCSRTFPSFQALGGHRASHKKPKLIAAAGASDEKKSVAISSDEEERLVFKNTHIGNLSLQLINNNKTKIHECSICGAEFASGQALGGHMRRHRAAPVNTTTTNANTTLSLIPMTMERKENKKGKNVISLDLDLNLPAPPEEFRLSSQKQQQQQKSSLVFCATTLVDCHY